MSDEIKITITATDGASKVFDDVVDSAKTVKEALEELDGSGVPDIAPGLDQLPPVLDSVRDSATGAATALDKLDSGDKPRQVGWLAPDVDKIPVSLDDIAEAANSASGPVDAVSTSFKSFGAGIKEAGEFLPGTLGSITTGFGDLVSKVDTFQPALGKAGAAAKGFASSLGTVGVVAAIGAASIAAIYLADALSDDGLAGRLDEIREASDKAAASIFKVAFSMDDAATGLELAQTNSELDTTIQNLSRLYEIDNILKGSDAISDWSTSGVEGFSSINEAQAEAIRLAKELGLNRDDEINYLPELESRIASLASQQELLNNIMSHSGPGAADARARLAELNEEYETGAIDQETYLWNLRWMNENLVTHYDMLSAAEIAQRQYADAAFGAAQSVGLLDTALERMALAGLNTDATVTALNLSTSALDTTFGTIVGTTNRLGASTQTVADWADGLTAATDGVSLIGQAYEEGRISLGDYTAGVAAAVSIQEDNAIVQAEIQAIQAKHLPLMADLTEQQRQYIEGLGDLSAEQQIAALGFMDTAQSARVMELAQLAAKAASGELGDTGTETATKIIAAAANADPVMKQMLLDMELINLGADGEVKVNFPNASNLTASVDSLTLSIDALTLALGGIPPSVDTSVNLTDNASGPLALIKQELANLDGQTSTVYINTIGGGLTLGVDARDGGVIGYANGGVVMAQLAEVGPELVRLANGGVALAPERGIYAVERGSYVMPAEATRGELNRHRGPAGVTNIYSGQVTQRITFEDSSFARRRAALQGQRR